MWTSNCISSNALHGVAWANDRFVATGDNGTIFTSLDGLSWCNHSVVTNRALYSVVYGNSRFVAVGSFTATSADGALWSASPINAPLILTRIIYANGSFVAEGTSGSPFYSTNCILTSNDGVNWQTRYSTPSLLSALAYQNGEYLALSGSTPLKSTDSITWPH